MNDPLLPLVPVSLSALVGRNAGQPPADLTQLLNLGQAVQGQVLSRAVAGSVSVETLMGVLTLRAPAELESLLTKGAQVQLRVEGSKEQPLVRLLSINGESVESLRAATAATPRETPNVLLGRAEPLAVNTPLTYSAKGAYSAIPPAITTPTAPSTPPNAAVVTSPLLPTPLTQSTFPALWVAPPMGGDSAQIARPTITPLPLLVRIVNVVASAPTSPVVVPPAIAPAPTAPATTSTLSPTSTSTPVTIAVTPASAAPLKTTPIVTANTPTVTPSPSTPTPTPLPVNPTASPPPTASAPPSAALALPTPPLVASPSVNPTVPTTNLSPVSPLATPALAAPLQNMPPLGTPVLAQIIAAPVAPIPNTPPPATVLHTAWGEIHLSKPLPLPVGTQLTILPLAASAPPLPPTAQAWPALASAMQTLSANDAPVLAALQMRLPQFTPQMLPAMMSFLPALNKGRISDWLGEEPVKALRTQGKEAIVQRLEQDFQSLQQLWQKPNDNGWQATLIPLLHSGEQMEYAKLMLKKQPSSGAGTPDVTRFMLEVDLSHFGAMQLDGFYKSWPQSEHTRQFSLHIRTHRPLEEDVTQEIRQIFSNALMITGLQGVVDFQRCDPFPTVVGEADFNHTLQQLSRA